MKKHNRRQRCSRSCCSSPRRRRGPRRRLARRVADAHRAAGDAALRHRRSTSTSAMTVWNRLPWPAGRAIGDVQTPSRDGVVLAGALRLASRDDACRPGRRRRAIPRMLFVAANAAFRNSRSAGRRSQGGGRAARRRDPGRTPTSCARIRTTPTRPTTTSSSRGCATRSRRRRPKGPPRDKKAVEKPRT